MTGLSTQQPYPGLRPFDFDDREFFFGREAQVRALRQKLNASRLVAVVGRSGCGKSSLVRAGLVPMLLGEKRESEQLWRIATFRPQGRPMEELTTALLLLKPGARPSSSSDGAIDQQALRHSRMKAMLQRSSLGLVEAASELGAPPDGGILIIIDQFEEIFRFEGAKGSDLDEPTAFVRLLVSAAGAATPRIHILLTMRLDFLGDCARFQGLPEAMSDGQFLVPNLNRAQRREAIEEPARRCGASISPAVTQRLLNEIGEDPDELPVLQHVLMRTWQEAKSASEITLAHYDATGGLKDAISRHADTVYASLPSDQHRAITERLFKSVSELDRRGRAVRRSPPLTIGDIAGVASTHEDSVIRVVDAFRAPECCFLMPPASEPLTTATPVDISHESLLRRWTRMTGTPPHEGWLTEEDKDGKIYRRLADDADTFADDRSAVMAPRQTRDAAKWWKKAQPNAEWAQRYGGKFALVEEFLHSSKLRERWLRYLTYGGWSVAAVAAAGAAFMTLIWFAEAQRREVETQKRAELEQKANDLAAQRNQSTREIELLRQQLEARNDTLRDQVRELQQHAGAAPSRLDEVVQVAKSEPAQASEPARQAGDAAASTNQQGYMWLGSGDKSNLQTLSGDPVSPTDVQVGQQYVSLLNIYLRSGLPDPSYNQQPSVAVIAPNTRIEITSPPVPYSRPSGTQYWAGVRVAAIALPTVYFQFGGGSRDQAQAVSKALQARGYRIPGEERTKEATGQRQVRYFYAADRPAAEKLASEVNAVLQKLSYPPSLEVTVSDQTGSAKKNPAGFVELWLDLPPR